MGRNYTLIEQADEHGVTVVQTITKAIEETGSINGAAKRLGVNRGTIKYHLERAGLTVQTTMTPSAKVIPTN